jgi:nucleotide-binding universal stress UspA family protein
MGQSRWRDGITMALFGSRMARHRRCTARGTDPIRIAIERPEADGEEPMTTVNRIVCATDFSAASEAAWHEARLLGKLFDAEIVLVHAMEPPPIVPGEPYIPADIYEEVVVAMRREAEAGFDRLLGSIAGSGLKVRIRQEDGPPAQRILHTVDEESADLLIVGTHGRAGFQRLLLGSVADRLVRQAACPVLTAPPGLPGGPRREIRRICYATDFSPIARAAWSCVAMIANAARAEIDLVHVTMEPVPDRHMSPETIGRMATLLHEQGRADVDRFLAQSTVPRDRVHVHLPQGVADEQIVRRARVHAADLIVMGTHGWSGVVRWMLGSVAQHVIQTAPCPVLTVSPVATSQPAGARARERGTRR